MSANVQQVERPPTSLRRLAAPRLEVTLFLMVIAMAALVRWRSLCAASAFVSGVVVFNRLALADFFTAEKAGHNSMPPILPCDFGSGL